MKRNESTEKHENKRKLQQYLVSDVLYIFFLNKRDKQVPVNIIHICQQYIGLKIMHQYGEYIWTQTHCPSLAVMHSSTSHISKCCLDPSHGTDHCLHILDDTKHNVNESCSLVQLFQRTDRLSSWMRERAKPARLLPPVLRPHNVSYTLPSHLSCFLLGFDWYVGTKADRSVTKCSLSLQHLQHFWHKSTNIS